MRARGRSLFFLAAWAVAAFLASSRAGAVCPPDCSGQTLTTPNFSHQDLTNANFTGATLIGAAFIRANLTGAKFDNAHFQSVSGFPRQTPNFSFANLTNASFTGAQFLAPTYLTYATLTCADFSHTNINNGNAIFGDDPLISDPGATCSDGNKSRTKFQSATMNCEFINDWKALDLTDAVVTACLGQLAGRDFSGAILSGVVLTNAVLDGASFAGADLTLATLDNVSLQCLTPVNGPPQCVDMSNALLQGAHFDNANLTGASLYKAFLSNNVNGKISQASSFQSAHLKNVNLAFAQMSGVNFRLANFYGNTPANPDGCKTTGGGNKSGFTNGCATALGATMTGTHFDDAYLFGVDFTSAAIVGVSFFEAVLAGANFASATIGSNPADASATSFSRAFLQGTNLDKATLSGADLSNAFFDFHAGGNLLAINLSGADHNQFACSTPSTCNPPSGDVCVGVRYPQTTAPGDNTTIICPDGKPAGSGGCGTDLSAGNTRWASNLTIGAPPDPGPPPGWYTNDATYTPKAPDSVICNKKGPSARVPDW